MTRYIQLTNTFYAIADENDLPTVDAPVIEIRRNETGYTPRHDITREQAKQLQDVAGHSDAEIQAAVICSMFGCWQNFDKIANMEEGC